MTVATPLPVALYRDPDSFRFERRTLFGTSWQMVAPDEALSGPGAYIAIELGGWPILAARAEDGVLRAFHNVSADGTTPVVPTGQGTCDAFRAPDGRIYRLDGSLQQAPRGTAESAALRGMPVGVWRSLIFVSAEPPSISLEEALVPFEIPFPHIGADAFTPAETNVTDIACDWKVFLDFGGALEAPAGMPAESMLGIAVSNRKGCILRSIDPTDPEALWVWIWPTVGIHRSRDGIVVHQLIANGKAATRIVRHRYLPTARGVDAAALDATWRAIAARQKAAAEAAQAALDAGATPPATPSSTSYGLHRIVTAILDPKSWSGFRPFVVDRKVRESDTVISLYLTPADGGRLPPFHPGEYMTCRLTVPGRDRPLIRNYTLSDRPGTGHYRLTVKREPGGGASHFLSDMEPGSRLEALMPRGSFRLNNNSPRPAVLLSAGVGVTPMISMLATIAASGGGGETWFFHGARNGAEHAFAADVRELATACPGVRAHVAYSQPGAADAPGRHYDVAGRLTIDQVRALLPDTDRDFYLCGPMGFMRDLYRGLREWGVPKEQIHHEFFGVAEAFEGDAKPAARPASAATPAEGDPVHTVTFARSGVRATWTPAEGSILELAETYGLNPPFSCRDGECMVCLQVVLDGEVQYWRRGDDPREPGCELLCCAFPKTDVVVDI